MRKKKLALNTITSIAFQITTVICGFVLPRLILQSYGSNVNGLVNSITQFLQIITFLDLGIGTVVQSALYKPLAEHDNFTTSKIMVSASRFFNKIAIILLAYVILLMFLYPFVVNDNFEWIYTATLIAAISISTFAQYYFGVADRLLLIADQRGYVQYAAQIITLVANTIACAFLISFGFSIHIVKLTTSLIYLIRPIFLRTYVSKNYNIDRKIKYTEEPIKQKWNGVAQHVAAVILDSTDNIVLTLFSSLSNVSVYSVYHMIIYGVKNLFIAATQGVHALLGELWAKNETGKLRDTFEWFEWCVNLGVVFLFGCTGMLVLPFIRVYTSGISDANYQVPLFACLITIAHACHCLRLPYNAMILAAGHYKQTQHNYIIAACLNLVISVIAVIRYGLIGVAVGTLIAMLYQTVWMAGYNSKHLICRSINIFIKQIVVDVITVIIGITATYKLEMNSISYLSWLILAIKVVTIWLSIIVFVNLLFYRKRISKLIFSLVKLGTKRA